MSSTQITLLERLVISSTRQAKRLLEVPQTITVVTQEDLEKRVVRDMQDLVRYEPGVSVDSHT